MVARNDSAMEISCEEFKELINNSEKLVVVDFFAEWCMPCLMIAPIIEELATQMKEVKFVKINIDDNEELKECHNITNIPCLIVFKSGKEVERIVGSRPAETIEEKIRLHL